MKNQNRILILLLSTFAFSFLAFISMINAQTNYYTTGNGNWTTTSKWTPSYPGETIAEGDSVFVNHNMSLVPLTGIQLLVSGVLIIQSAGDIGGAKKIMADATGVIINDGSITITQELHIDGKLFNYKTIEVMKLHVDGYVCNTGTISIDSGQKIDLHGGTIECGGVLIADEIKIHNNGFNVATLQDISTCEDGGDDPIIDLQSGTIDSSTVVICGFAFPVELYTYEVKLEDNNVRIEWVTATEIDNNYFVVERSRNGNSFEEIGTEEGAGNSDAFRYYAVTDRFPFDGISCYRLKQVDFDGKATYFDTKMVNNNDGYTDKHGLSVFPNPIMEHNKFSIGLEGFEGNTVQLKIQNMNGYLVYSDEINISQERELIELETNIIQESGMYVVSVFKNDRWYHHKFMCVK